MIDVGVLAPYLGYGLRVQLTDTPSKVCGVVEQISVLDRHHNIVLLGVTDDSGNRWQMGIYEVKPCFRPFRALCDEIEHEGKIIIPAVEVARLAHGLLAGGNYRVVAEEKEIDGSECVRVRSDNRLVDDVVIHSSWAVVHEHEITHNHYAIHQLLRRLHFAPPGLEEAEYIVIGEG